MSSHRSAALLLAAGATLALAACGSSKSTISKSQFVAKSNAICASTNTRQNAAGAALGNKPTRQQIVGVVNSVFVPSIQSAINQIRALGAPSGDQSKVTNMLALAQTDLNQLKANPILVTSPTLFHNFASVAHPYGLTSCAPNS